MRAKTAKSYAQSLDLIDHHLATSAMTEGQAAVERLQLDAEMPRATSPLVAEDADRVVLDQLRRRSRNTRNPVVHPGHPALPGSAASVVRCAAPPHDTFFTRRCFALAKTKICLNRHAADTRWLSRSESQAAVYRPVPHSAAYSVCRDTPNSRATSALGTPRSTSARALSICSTESFGPRS